MFNNIIITLILLLLHSTGYGANFHLIQKEGIDDSNKSTLLVIGGIHGNEPGSYFAAALLAQYYTIKKGSLWIVPDLNRQSIQQNNRGIYGDMNRKFASIESDDPDFTTVQEIKSVLTHPRIDLILNLHDGHGFYRKEYQNTIFNPNAWGQTCVIDQGALDQQHPYGNLNEIASKVSLDINNRLIEGHHFFDVRNTNTRFDDEAMKHSLTYFSVTNNKPAFAIETSKNLPTLPQKVFYQLLAIESFMNLMDIRFERTFDLSLVTIGNLLNEYGFVTINNKIYLDLKNLKNTLSFIPLKSERNQFQFSHPLGNYRSNRGSIEFLIGNKVVSSLSPSFHIYEEPIEAITLLVDGKTRKVDFATDFSVSADLEIINDDPNIRVNIIGFTRKGVKDESNIRVSLNDLDPKYAVDTSNRSYRVEFYRQNRFCGMILVHFN